LEDALALLDKAIESSESGTRKVKALLQRATIRQRCGDRSGAVTDARAAIHSAPPLDSAEVVRAVSILRELDEAHLQEIVKCPVLESLEPKDRFPIAQELSWSRYGQ